MLRFVVSALAALFLASPTFAADCDAVAQVTSGSFTVQSVLLLDSDTASATGAVCDLSTWGAPDFMRLTVATSAGCANGWEARVSGGPTSAGSKVDLAGGLVTQTAGGSEVKASVPRFVQARSFGLSGCTDFDLIAELHYDNEQNTPAATSCDDQPWAGPFNPTEAGATDDFMNLDDHTASTTEANEDDFLAHQARRGHRLACDVDVAPGVGNDSWTATLRQGAPGALANTVVVCDIDEAATTCVSTAFIDLTAGNVLTVGLDSSGGGSDPDAAAAFRCSVCLGE